MLPRQSTLPPHPLAKLNPSLSHSCSLFFTLSLEGALFPALPVFRINHLQPLFAKHRGWGIPNAYRAQREPLRHPSSISPFRMNTYAKPGGRGPINSVITNFSATQEASFFSAPLATRHSPLLRFHNLACYLSFALGDGRDGGTVSAVGFEFSGGVRELAHGSSGFPGAWRENLRDAIAWREMGHGQADRGAAGGVWGGRSRNSSSR